jgi:(p)ppGpp synthase/HD superfamily hydrolase
MNERERVEFHRDFERALTFATRLHAAQTRKQTEIPYIAHLISVAGLVLEYGGNRDEAIAALLHDSIEDQGTHYPDGVPALKTFIESEFGAPVLDIVEGCTDTETEPKPPWRARKEAYIRHIQSASESVRLVSCADKLHNARSIVMDLRVFGAASFERFKGGKDGTLWYYRELSERFTRLGPAEPAAELSRTVATMSDLASCGGPLRESV